MKKLLFFISVVLLLQACKKEEEAPNTSRYWTTTLFQTDFEYQRIALTNNNIYCYGIKLNQGNTGLIYTFIRSENDAISWETVNFSPEDIYDLGGWQEMAFFNDTSGMISGYRKLLQTNDGGKHWDTISLGYDSFSGLLFHENKLFGYMGGQFRYSENHGNDWVKINEPQFVSSLCFINGNKGFASSPEGFYATADGGASWSLVSTNGKDFLKMSFNDDLNGIATSIFQESPHAYPETYINITGDGGASWRTIKLDSVSTARLEPETCVLYKSENEIYVGCVNGIYLSTDRGYTWKQDYTDTLYNGGIWIRDIKLRNGKILAVGWGGLILTK